MMQEGDRPSLRHFVGWSIRSWSLFPRVQFRLFLLDHRVETQVSTSTGRAYLVFHKPEFVGVDLREFAPQIADIEYLASDDFHMRIYCSGHEGPVFDVQAQGADWAYI